MMILTGLYGVEDEGTHRVLATSAAPKPLFGLVRDLDLDLSSQVDDLPREPQLVASSTRLSAFPPFRTAIMTPPMLIAPLNAGLDLCHLFSFFPPKPSCRYNRSVRLQEWRRKPMTSTA